jgi:hypothetical protein
MPSRANRSKKPKTKAKRPVKPERVVYAKPKTHKDKSRPKSKNLYKHLKLSNNMVTYIILGLFIIVAIIVIYVQYLNTMMDLDKSRQATSINKLSSDNWKLIERIGTNEILLESIDSHQSLPQDSLQVVLKVARAAKLKCLSDTDFVASYSFTIKNVVYDDFILAESMCGGKTQTVLAKLDSGWAVIHQGNNLIECNSINSMKLPKGVAEYCQTNNVRYLNPNP